MSVQSVRWLFRLAGGYGVLVIAPQYFLEDRIGLETPPAITHPEHFYGFVGLALVWQIAFFIIARDPVRFRPFMVVAVLEKMSFGLAAVALFLQGRLPGLILGFGIFDLVLAALFVWAYASLRGKA